MRTAGLVSSLLCVALGCGAKPAPTASTSAPTAAATEPTPVASATSSTASTEEDEPDPTESTTPIAMQVVFPAAPKFPPRTTDEGECWKSIELGGKHAADYATLVAQCGTPAGLLEYAKPVVGALHHPKDQRDTYTLKLKGGLCYRYFAVADDSIKDLDIVITSKGALVAEDKASSPVAIIDATKTWCQADDVEYEFRVEVDGVGKGRYTFGVWARKK